MTEHTAPGPQPPANARLALEVPRWALDFYVRHLALVVGISLIPAAARFAVALWGEGLSAPAHIALEVIAEGTRLLLVVLLIRLAILRDERVRSWSHLRAGRRIKAFLARRWPSLLIQVVLLLGFTVVFDVIPERIVPLWLPASAEDTYWAVLLAAKNVTVIAFTIIWMVGAVRQMLVEGGRLLEWEGRQPAAPR
ncbi:hypothetical protein [Streptomonospora litoralis]|uniref:Uncharacterized protein n=1 Tax=Streptomonospora litoralis TaxID=2498135 RepID=A0A4P6Q1F7_9ACTN|nr:hypothetical protein [Streptomonospora litoralis]QBI53061.1 hypothetical protein EKD16_06315 [Streptomonospora litoralis]